MNKSISSDLSQIKSSFNQNISENNMKKKNSEMEEILIYKKLQKIDKSEKKIKEIPKWYIKNRKKVLDLIVTFGKIYEFTNHTLYSAINFTDKILTREKEMNEKNINLITIACCLMASKFVENDAFDIDLNEINLINKNMYYSVDEIYKNEIYVVQQLNYNLSIPSVYEFIQYLNIIGVFYQGEIKNVKKVSNDIQDITKKVIWSEISLNYPNEVLAMGIIKAIRKKYDLDRSSMKKLLKRYFFNYDKNLLKNCYDDIKVVGLGMKKHHHKKESNSNLINGEKHHHHHKEKNKHNNDNINNKDNNMNNNDNNKDNEKIESFVRRNISSKTTKLSNSSLKKTEENPKKNTREIGLKKSKTIIEDNFKEEKIIDNKRSKTKGKKDSLNSSLDISSNEENQYEVKTEEVNKRELLERNKKKKSSVRINENFNEYFFEENSPTSIKLSYQIITKEKDKSRKIKPVNKDKINFPFSIKRVKKFSFVSPDYKRNYQDIEIKDKLFKSWEKKSKNIFADENIDSDNKSKFHKVKSSFNLNHKNNANNSLNKGYKTPIYIEEK